MRPRLWKLLRAQSHSSPRLSCHLGAPLLPILQSRGLGAERPGGVRGITSPRHPMRVPTEHPLFSLVPGAQRPLRAALGQSQPRRPLSRGHGCGRPAGKGAPVADLKSSGPRLPGRHWLAGVSVRSAHALGNRGSRAPCADGEVARLHCPDEKWTCPHGSHRHA